MGFPKALLRYRGETFLDRLIGIFKEVCGSVTVVLGHEPQRIVSGLARAAQATFVHNENHALGQLSSLQCGLRASTGDAFLYCPVDYPRIERETVHALCSVFDGRDLLVIPRFGEKRGHPVLFHSSLRSEFLALPPDDEARTVVHRYARRTRYLDVPDSGILRDVDDPEAYRELTSLTGSEEKSQ